MSREELLKKIQQLSFALVETELFLDTHPDCQAAMTHYKAIVEELAAATAEYQNMYGPLIARETVGDRWSWVDSPWPWQNETQESHNNGSMSNNRGRGR